MPIHEIETLQVDWRHTKMSAAWPPSLKPLAKYLVRAKEVEQIDPFVAYACRFYACELGLKLRDKKDPEAAKFMKGLIEKCEQDKEKLGDTSLLKQHVEEFAWKVFFRADTEDRSGNATRTTVRTFYAALCFLEVLNSLQEEPSEDIKQKIKYCKFKVADISRCLREGIRPVPGPPDRQAESQYEDMTQHDISFSVQEPGTSYSPTSNNDSQDSQVERKASGESNENVTSVLSSPQVDYTTNSNETAANDTSESAGDSRENNDKTVSSSTEANNNNNNTKKVTTSRARLQTILEAQKLSKNASSALDFQDVDFAIRELEKALSLLRQC
ncbi:hypothetical protein GAYE_PCTG60G1359 [Galdieria yellowstonensis]|uniref:Vacuolar protein sorting-associated protein VTA1 n=1 Tax=Galdieria yellowstonensis TaxID=3028027 RepID=A0AAV9I7E3_9RHOD|nr:hypothetical protein GAYE_PCTG60G1359 [Galdieria yellowstonensis]